MIGMTAESLIHPEDRLPARENARKMLRGELGAPYEFRIVTKQGDTRWILETVSPIIYEGKRAILGNSMDITVFKLAAEALRLSEEKYRRIVDTASEGIWALDGQRLTTFANARMAAMLGYTPGEMIGRPFEAFMFDEDLDDHAARMRPVHRASTAATSTASGRKTAAHSGRSSPPEPSRMKRAGLQVPSGCSQISPSASRPRRPCATARKNSACWRACHRHDLPATARRDHPIYFSQLRERPGI